GAVVGRGFDVVLLAHAAESTADAVLGHLAAPVAAGLVEESSTAGGFRFAHALVHETVYGDLLPAARARLHQRVAAALEARAAADHAGAPLAQLAAHYARAAPLGAAAQAAEWAVPAAQQAGGTLRDRGGRRPHE